MNSYLDKFRNLGWQRGKWNHEPPRPARCLSQLRAESRKIWEAKQYLIRSWIELHLPGEIAPGITGEAKHEQVERWFDEGVLRFQRDETETKILRKFFVQVWTGDGYKTVGKCCDV